MTMGQSILYASNPKHRDPKNNSGLTRVGLYAQLDFVSEDPKCSGLTTTGSFLSFPTHQSLVLISGPEGDVKLALNDVTTDLSENAPGM